MKILKLQFKNINSLEGEWIIDFTEPSYSTEGIFAITGPTGAGKTSVLDAITIALYGSTPRLGKITGSFNEVMSRRAGEFYSELTFETGSEIYTAHFYQHRSRKKSGERLQSPKHEIFDKDGKIIETGLSRVPDVVKEKTGMDFERFTKSVLLAQGGFSVFLEASPAERAPILEEITGTEIYSKISLKVHDRKKEETEKLKELENKIRGIKLLSKDEEDNYNKELSELKSKENIFKESLTEVDTQIEWLKNIEKIQKDLLSKNKEYEDVLHENKNLVFEKEKLEKAKKAVLLDKYFENLKSLRKRKEENKKELESSKTIYPKKEKLFKEIKTLQEKLKKELEDLKLHNKSELEIIKQVRALDLILNENKKNIKDLESEIFKNKKDLDKIIDLKDQSLKKADNEKKNLSIINSWFKDNFENKILEKEYYKFDSDLNNLKDNLKYLNELKNNAKNLKSEKNKSEKELLDLSAIFNYLKTGFDNLSLEIKDLNNYAQDLIKGFNLSDIRACLEDIKNKKNTLEKLTEVLGIRDKNKGLKAQAGKDLEEIQGKIKDLNLVINNDTKLIEQKEKTVQALEKQMVLVSKILSLERERKNLEHGKPCPLCGSKEHPFVQKLDIKQEKNELEKERAELKELNKKLEENKILKGKKDTEKNSLEEKISTLDNELNYNNEQIKKLLGDSGNLQEDEINEKNQFYSLESKRLETLISEYEKTELKIKSKTKDLEKLRKDYFDHEKKIISLKEINKAREKELLNLNNEISDKEGRSAEFQNKVKQNLNPFNINDISLQNIDKIKQNLKDRFDEWNNKVLQQKESDKKISEIENTVSKLESSILDKKENIEIKNQNLESKKYDYNAIKSQREEIFGKKDPDKEEALIEQSIFDKESEVSKTDTKYNNLNQELSLIKESIVRLKKECSDLQGELLSSQDNFNKKIEQNNFDSETDYLNACMPGNERDLLEEKIKSREKKADDLLSVIKSLEKSLSEEKEKNITDKNKEELFLQKENLDIEYSKIQQKTGEVNHILNENIKNRIILKDQAGEIDIQKKECLKWNDLHELIGSADGKKFRNYAQGLTFEIMVGLANNQLKNMTDRYILERDSSNPLELNVMDNYQAGEVRSSKNLSGGESFLVSLSLALGLSDMASKNVNVDSLFLDEGFGTLDEEALETALNSLTNLNRGGKIIGVISHVQELKERIPVQINIEPVPGGKSIISGPGCSNLN